MERKTGRMYIDYIDNKCIRKLDLKHYLEKVEEEGKSNSTNRN